MYINNRKDRQEKLKISFCLRATDEPKRCHSATATKVTGLIKMITFFFVGCKISLHLPQPPPLYSYHRMKPRA